jgi:cell shape-determining protein MreD
MLAIIARCEEQGTGCAFVAGFLQDAMDKH